MEYIAGIALLVVAIIVFVISALALKAKSIRQTQTRAARNAARGMQQPGNTPPTQGPAAVNPNQYQIRWHLGFPNSKFWKVIWTVLGVVALLVVGTKGYEYVRGTNLSPSGAWKDYSWVTLLLAAAIVIFALTRIKAGSVNFSLTRGGAVKTVAILALVLIALMILLDPKSKILANLNPSSWGTSSQASLPQSWTRCDGSISLPIAISTQAHALIPDGSACQVTINVLSGEVVIEGPGGYVIQDFNGVVENHIQSPNWRAQTIRALSEAQYTKRLFR